MARKDPAHRALQMHISDVFRRYGSPCLMVNLVQQQEQAPRESIIGSLFTEAIEQINQFLPTQHQIDYYAWDFKKGICQVLRYCSGIWFLIVCFAVQFPSPRQIQWWTSWL